VIYYPASSERCLNYLEIIGGIEKGVGDLFTHFNKTGFDTSFWQGEIDKVEIPRDTVFEDIPERKKQSIQERLDAIGLIGSSDQAGFTQACIKYYKNCEPTEGDVARAKEELKNALKYAGIEGEKTCGPEDVKTDIEKCLGACPELKGMWDVKVKGEGKTASVQKDIGKIVLGGNYENTKEGMNVTIIHEVMGHVYQWSNGKLQEPLQNTFFFGTDGRTIKTYEGLATSLVARFGLNDIDKDKRNSAYIIAVDARLRGAGRVEVIEVLMNLGVDKNNAEFVANHVSRGLRNPEGDGCFPKDAVYRMGKWDVEKYLEYGGDLKTLYTGCISMEELPQIRKLLDEGLLVPARYLPEGL
jgi:hypothetical protein